MFRPNSFLPRASNQLPMFFLPKPNINARLVRQVAPTLTRIIQHPFNQHMYIGTLPYPYFKQFLTFDVHYYLPQYIDAVHRLSIRFQTINQPEYSVQFMQLEDQVKGYIEHICAMYPDRDSHPRKGVFFEGNGNPTNGFDPDCLTHLLKEDTPGMMAARIIACLWLYLQLGQHLNSSHCSADNRYRSWIEMYHRPGFIHSTHLLLETLNALIQTSSTLLEQQEIIHAFEESLSQEFKIIDCIYPQELVAKSEHILYCR